MKRFFISLVVATALFSLNAQIKVATNNNVGIGEDDPVSKLSIGGPGHSVATANIDNILVINSSRALRVMNTISTGDWGAHIALLHLHLLL
jgi:hypothetical protein